MPEKNKFINKGNCFSLLNESESEGEQDSNTNTTTVQDDKKTTPNTNTNTTNTKSSNNSINNITKTEEDNLKLFTKQKETKQNKHNKYQNREQKFIKPVVEYKEYKEYKENDDDLGEFTSVSNKRKERIIPECEYKSFNDESLDLKMPNKYTVLAHHNDDKNWDLLSYLNITTLYKWSDIPKFFNTLDKAKGESTYADFDIFIMKNDILPLWEDPENRDGGVICSLKIDALDEAYEVFKKLAYHMVNNTLLKFSPNTWNYVNGLSFSPRTMEHISPDAFCVIIKLWFKKNIVSHSSLDKVLNEEINKFVSGYTVKIKIIKPEY